MKTKYLFIASLFFALPMFSQETYEGAEIATEDLNGTARYVGMGGAMDALGADISTISSNPAGIGMFRKSTAALSVGLVNQMDAHKFNNQGTTNVSFDQIGFVVAMKSGKNGFMNVGFNYHKSRNFNQILSAANTLGGASANRLTANKDYARVFNLSYDSGQDIYGSNDLTYSQADDLYENYLLLGDQNGFNAEAFGYDKAMTGYIGQYDINLSGNINDRVYLGLTMGFHDVHYKNWSTYHETYPGMGDLYYDDYRHITGSGVNVALGVIFRPIEYSPFRVGVSVSSPTFYNLTSSNYTSLETNNDGNLTLDNVYDYKFYTPWRFGLSLGHTIGNNIALGASYEFSSFKGCDARIDDGTTYYWDDWYGPGYVDHSHSDQAMNDNIDETLKAVHTFKLGVEYKPIPEVSLRAGYNYVSPVYDEGGWKEVAAQSPGVSYTSDPSFTNWKATNRFTLGAGYTFGKFNVDLAYQYSARNGDYYAFTDSDTDLTGVNKAPKTEVNFKRNQFIMTLGYRF